MKTRATALVCATALVLAGMTSSAKDTTAADSSGDKKPGFAAKAADLVLVRPVSLLSTAAGGVVFVLGLPVTAIRKEVKPAGDELVVKPFNKTFKRPLGDMDAMAD